MLQPTSGLGQEVESAYRAAVQDWLLTHRRGHQIEVALTSNLQRVDIHVQLWPARAGLAVVSISGRRRLDQDVYPAPVECTPYSAYRHSGLTPQ